MLCNVFFCGNKLECDFWGAKNRFWTFYFLSFPLKVRPCRPHFKNSRMTIESVYENFISLLIFDFVFLLGWCWNILRSSSSFCVASSNNGKHIKEASVTLQRNFDGTCQLACPTQTGQMMSDKKAVFGSNFV